MLVLHYEDLAPLVAHAVDHQWLDSKTLEGCLLDRCLAAHREDNWPGADHLDDLAETDAERHTLSNLRCRPFQIDDPTQAINQCLKAIFENHFRRELTELQTRAANTPDTATQTFADLQQRIKEVQKLLRQPPRITGPAPL